MQLSDTVLLILTHSFTGFPWK